MLNQYPAGQTGPYTTFDVGAIQITQKYLSGAIQFNSIAFRLASRYHVIGSGYHSPVDVSVSSDGATAWVLESSGGGALLKVWMSPLVTWSSQMVYYINTGGICPSPPSTP